MSYIINIGNAVIDAAWASDDGQPYARWVVHSVVSKEVRAFPFDPTGQSNSRAPGYTQWANFLEEAGIAPLFIGADGLMAKHPGIAPLHQRHLDRVRDALVSWMKSHPYSRPGWDWNGVGTDDNVRGRDGVLARLLWLEWWMDWALKNCERPAVYNT